MSSGSIFVSPVALLPLLATFINIIPKRFLYGAINIIMQIYKK